MAVVSLRQLRDANGNYNASGQGDEEDVFRVEVDDKTMTQNEVVAGAFAFGLPQLFAPRPGKPIFLVNSIRIRRQEGTSLYWLVTVGYSTRTPKEENKQDNPLNEPVKRTLTSEKGMEILTKDINGVACLNTAGVAFDPPIEVRRSKPRLTFVRNELSHPGAKQQEYEDTVNSASWAGGAAGTVYCDSISAEEEYRNGVNFWRVTYVFLYDRRGWQPRPLNQGFEAIWVVDGEGNPVDPYRRRITDGNGEPITSPVPLNSTGDAIPKSLLPDAAIHLEFAGYPSKNFHSLGLPA
ncbi:MAG: hypothetical protein IT428_13870 [Planctomycetaceae bacterium]|nr:hypothetical protein [Planctomycetaceae bacterium]